MIVFSHGENETKERERACWAARWMKKEKKKKKRREEREGGGGKMMDFLTGERKRESSDKYNY